ncbi:nucleotidyltransferase domain-containing protein [Clostridium sp. MB40-C1]|uniref:type VII toxin-antitoxin system MntA family adenylyltransferase antitoxin n=1 Tax=Clostridium sp. MB40-C1 TaxID=3070996 RepID=UPI0027DEE59D|nr:nucleotidyltransferase domain-containing protein [Clostridium sp. MB40-C1]WMJ79349.1 nucleotidyltransferase domain-containing protein [Clostridium sp. MB40-C1]
MSTLEDKNIILDKLNSTEFIEFMRNFDIDNVVVFGSICNDEFNELSDVDIALLGENKISLDNILDIELFLERLLEREIDVIDLRSESLDLFVKINILNSGKIIYSTDDNKLFEEFCDYTDRIYRENEDFMYFRRGDVLS